MMGDFNGIVSIHNRRGQEKVTNSMRKFNSFINNNHFMVVELSGKNFTWARGNSRCKLDWCLCHSEWYSRFPSLKLLSLPKSFSNHNPLFLQLESSMDWGHKPFRSLDVWLGNHRFRPLVESNWKMLNEFREFKALKPHIREWNLEYFGDVDHKIKTMECEINSLDNNVDLKPLVNTELARLGALSSNPRYLKTRNA